MGVFADHDHGVLRRRITAKLRPLADFFGIAEPAPGNDPLLEHIDAVIDRASDAVLSDEHSLAAAVAKIDERFKAVWPTDDLARSMLVRARSELAEVDRALEDWARYRGQGHDELLREHLLEEIGDAMLALGRLALAVGGASALQPLSMTIVKTLARLRELEQLAASENAGHFTKRDLWKMAKQLADARRKR